MCVSTCLRAKTVPSPCVFPLPSSLKLGTFALRVSTAFVAKTVALPCVLHLPSTAFVAKTLPLPCGCTCLQMYDAMGSILVGTMLGGGKEGPALRYCTSLCTCLHTRNIAQKAGPFAVARRKVVLPCRNRLAYSRVHRRSASLLRAVARSQLLRYCKLSESPRRSLCARFATYSMPLDSVYLIVCHLQQPLAAATAVCARVRGVVELTAAPCRVHGHSGNAADPEEPIAAAWADRQAGEDPERASMSRVVTTAALAISTAAC